MVSGFYIRILPVMRLFKKKRDALKSQKQIYNTVEVLHIKDPHRQIVSNIHEFIEWSESIGIAKKRISMDRLQFYADFFIAYHTYIVLKNRKDTIEYRKKWFYENKSRVIKRELVKSGL